MVLAGVSREVASKMSAGFTVLCQLDGLRDVPSLTLAPPGASRLLAGGLSSVMLPSPRAAEGISLCKRDSVLARNGICIYIVKHVIYDQ